MNVEEIKNKFPQGSIVTLEYGNHRQKIIGAIKYRNEKDKDIIRYSNGLIMLPVGLCVDRNSSYKVLGINSVMVYFLEANDILRFANGKERHILFSRLKDSSLVKA